MDFFMLASFFKSGSEVLSKTGSVDVVAFLKNVISGRLR
jgi:hypothetical protein